MSSKNPIKFDGKHYILREYITPEGKDEIACDSCVLADYKSEMSCPSGREHHLHRKYIRAIADHKSSDCSNDNRWVNHYTKKGTRKKLNITLKSKTN